MTLASYQGDLSLDPVSGLEPVSGLDMEPCEIWQKTRPVWRLPTNKTLFWQGEPQPRSIEVVSGVIRAVYLLRSGERKVLGFYWPGDIIPAASGLRGHCFAAESVAPTVVRQCQAEAPGFNAEALSGDALVLQDLLEWISAIGERSALGRVAWFLLAHADRFPRIAPESDVFKFVVPRKDIADHLGLSLETVCRSLTSLETQGVIELPNCKTVRFKNRPQLMKLARRRSEPH